MSDLIQAITSPVNLFLGVLLVGVFGYWVMVCLGALDIDAFDFDIDVDVDVEGDVDVDVDVDSEVGHQVFPGSGILKFFNLGEVPFMVLLSVFLLVLWAAGVGTHRFIGGWGFLIQLLMLIPFAFAAALLTKVLTAPLKKVFQDLEASQHSGEIDFLGMRCVVASATLDARHGQVEVTTEGAPIKLNAYLDDPNATLSKGDEVVIVSHDPDRGTYRVRGF